MYIEGDELKNLIPVIQSAPRLAVDTETSGLDAYLNTLLLVQISSDKEDYVINAGKTNKNMMKYIFQVIKDRNIEVTGFNIKFDMKFIYHNYGVMLENVFDIQTAEILAFLGVGNKYPSLSDTLFKHLGVSLEKETRQSFIDKEDFEFTPEQIEYAGDDTRYLLPLRDKMELVLKERKNWKTFAKIESPLIPVTGMMEYTGIKFNVPFWRELAKKATLKVDEYSIQLKEYLNEEFDKFCKGDNAYEACEYCKIPVKQEKKAERERLKSIVTYDEIKQEVISRINWGSPFQPRVILQRLGVPVKTTNAKELAMYKGEHKIIDILLGEREELKKKGMYGDDFLKNVNMITQAVHTKYNNLGAATSRFSSEEPNLQNIIAEEDYRRAFVSREGYLLATGDYSQIELRILAEVSREPRFLHAFQNNLDLHAQTGSDIFEVPLAEVTKQQRRFAKSMNFAVVYGTTAKGIAYNFGLKLPEAEAYLDKYFKIHSTLKKFILEFSEMCLENGYAPTMFGTKRFLSFPRKATSNDDYKALAHARRQAVNTLPQGTCANIIKIALNYMHYNNPFGYDVFRPLLNVHDEIVVEFREEIKEEAVKFMEECMKKAGEIFLKSVSVEYEINVNNYWEK